MRIEDESAGTRAAMSTAFARRSVCAGRAALPVDSDRSTRGPSFTPCAAVRGDKELEHTAAG